MANTDKVEFVKQKYPDLHKVNPYVDFKFLDEVKSELIKHGYYCKGAKHLYNDTSITNIILRAQGKKIVNRRISSRASA